MIYRCIAPTWLKDESSNIPATLEGEFTEEQIEQINKEGYNVYFFPNHPSTYDPNVSVNGSNIDQFNFVFVDMDLKDNQYNSADEFIERLNQFSLLPTSIVKSGNGVHAYWLVKDLDAVGYLRLQRRLCRYFRTDEAVSKICQLMRVPYTYNTKAKDTRKLCEAISSNDQEYTVEQLDKALPLITQADEAFCQRHYQSTYSIADKTVVVPDKLPLKFAKLLKDNQEVQRIWSGNTEDRSEADYRLGHLLFASNFTKEEALAVLAKTIKAQDRAPVHQVAYAQNIIDKVWTYEVESKESLIEGVDDILEAPAGDHEGVRLPCWSYLDDTERGFKTGDVIGLVAGSGVGKTTMSLNMFMGFVTSNPNYDHLFIPLEQPKREIAERWKLLCGANTRLHSKVKIISNYDKEGMFRNLSLDEIEQAIVDYEKSTGRKVGCVVIDHIGALKAPNKKTDRESLSKICERMKSIAIRTKTLLVMQSQAPREKAGIGDLELNKDAAFGTVAFESWCDYLITLWQPIKRCYNDIKCPTVMSFKFCKIRHKRVKVDKIQEDVRYNLLFDSNTEQMRELTQSEEEAFDFFNTTATNLRKLDKKTDVLTYVSRRVDNGAVNSNKVLKRPA